MPEVSHDQVSGARQDWIGRGLDPAAFDRALSGVPEPEPTPAVAPDPGSVLSDPQIASARKTWTDAGLDPATFDAAMGTEAPVEISPEIAANLAEHALTPGPIAPSDYRIDWMAAGFAGELDTSALVDLNASATQMLSVMHMDPGLGAGLIEHTARVAATWKGISEAERGLWQAGEAYKFPGGLEAYEKAQSDAKAALLALTDSHPFAKLLAENPAVMGDAWTLKTILFHAEKVGAALAARSKSN